MRALTITTRVPAFRAARKRLGHSSVSAITSNAGLMRSRALRVVQSQSKGT